MFTVVGYFEVSKLRKIIGEFECEDESNPLTPLFLDEIGQWQFNIQKVEYWPDYRMACEFCGNAVQDFQPIQIVIETEELFRDRFDLPKPKGLFD